MDKGGRDRDDDKICRDFMRNVCKRGAHCRFTHPVDMPVKAEPTFCHDFQQGKCFRGNRGACKFIHCTREEEETYKATGVLTQSYLQGGGGEERAPPRGGSKMGGRGGDRRGGRASWEGGQSGRDERPLCKDFLNGNCDRPPGGCKFRHHGEDPNPRYGKRASAPSGSRAPAPAARRRPAQPSYYAQGPEAKRMSYDPYAAAAALAAEYAEEEYYGAYDEDINLGDYGASDETSGEVVGSGTGYGTLSGAMKAMEDENFMLKRRIEELKKQVSDLVATNDFLLSQNATYRLTMAASQQNSNLGGGEKGTNLLSSLQANLLSSGPNNGVNPPSSTPTTNLNMSNMSSMSNISNMSTMSNVSTNSTPLAPPPPLPILPSQHGVKQDLGN